MGSDVVGRAKTWLQTRHDCLCADQGAALICDLLAEVERQAATLASYRQALAVADFVPRACLTADDWARVTEARRLIAALEREL